MNAYGLFIRSLVIEYRKFKYYGKKNEDIIEEFEPRRNPSGSSFPKIPENPKNRDSIIIENMDYIQPYEMDLELAVTFIDIVQDFIDDIEDDEAKKVIVEKFIEGDTKCVARLEQDYATTNMGIWRKLDKEIEQYIKNKPKMIRITSSRMK